MKGQKQEHDYAPQRHAVRSAVLRLLDMGVSRGELAEDAGVDDSVVTKLVGNKKPVGKEGVDERTESATPTWFETEPIEPKNLLRFAVSVSRASLFDGFSQLARNAIVAKSGWLYLHKTVVSTEKRVSNSLTREVWKLHRLRFSREHSMYVADTSSEGPSYTEGEKRYFRYFVSGSTGENEVSRLFVYGRRHDRSPPDSSEGTDLSRQISRMLNGKYAELPGERIFPKVSFKRERDPQVFAGIGIWTDWQRDPKPVLSQCLLLNAAACTGMLTKLTKSPDGIDLEDSEVDAQASIHLYEYLSRVWAKEWAKSNTTIRLPFE